MTLFFPIVSLIVLSSATSLYTKRVLNKVHPLILLTFSGIFFGLFSCFFLFTEPILNIKIVELLIFASSLHFLGALLINKSIQISELSFITSFTSFASIFGIIFSIAFSGDYPTLAGLVGVLLIMFGTFALYKTENNPNCIKPILFRIAGIIFISLAAVVLKMTFQSIGYFMSTLFFWLFLGLLSVPTLAIFVWNKNAYRKTIKENFALLVVVSVFAISVSALTIYLFNKTNVGYVFAFSQLSIILTIVLSGNMLNEKKYSTRIIPAIIMIPGMIVIYYLG